MMRDKRAGIKFITSSSFALAQPKSMNCGLLYPTIESGVLPTLKASIKLKAVIIGERW